MANSLIFQHVNGSITTTLNGGISSGATSLVLTSATSFPLNGMFVLLIDSEYFLCTSRSGTTCTVTPGFDGSTQAAHSNGATITLIETAAVFNSFGISKPGGRLTLTSGSPIMSADVTGAGTIYYDTDESGLLPIANAMYAIPSDEISLILDATNHLSGKIYDVFAIPVNGLPKLVTGPAWSTSPSSGFGGARGTGAGTTELQLSYGIWTNKNSLTHAWNNSTDFGAIAANQATYLGSFYATANAQTGMQFKAAAASGGSNAILALYNFYNRRRVNSFSRDNKSSWTTSSTTPTTADASTSNRISYLDGFATSHVFAEVQCIATNGQVSYQGLLRNATSGTPGAPGGESSTVTANPRSKEAFPPLLGLSYIQAMEWTNSGTSTFYGSGSITNGQWLQVELEM